MIEPPRKIAAIKSWVTKAESDYANAENTIKMSPEVCSEANQAITIARQIRDWARTHLPPETL